MYSKKHMNTADDFVPMIDFIRYVDIPIDKARDLLHHHRLNTKEIDTSIWVHKAEIGYFRDYFDMYPQKKYMYEV